MRMSFAAAALFLCAVQLLDLESDDDDGCDESRVTCTVTCNITCVITCRYPTILHL